MKQTSTGTSGELQPWRNIPAFQGLFIPREVDRDNQHETPLCPENGSSEQSIMPWPSSHHAGHLQRGHWKASPRVTFGTYIPLCPFWSFVGKASNRRPRRATRVLRSHALVTPEPRPIIRCRTTWADLLVLCNLSRQNSSTIHQVTHRSAWPTRYYTLVFLAIRPLMGSSGTPGCLKRFFQTGYLPIITDVHHGSAHECTQPPEFVLRVTGSHALSIFRSASRRACHSHLGVVWARHGVASWPIIHVAILYACLSLKLTARDPSRSSSHHHRAPEETSCPLPTLEAHSSRTASRSALLGRPSWHL